MGLSLPHLLVLAVIVLVLFGRGRISEMMGDFGKGIKSFKTGMNEEADRPPIPPAAQIPPPPAAAPPAPIIATTPTGEPIADPTQTPPQN